MCACIDTQTKHRGAKQSDRARSNDYGYARRERHKVFTSHGCSPQLELKTTVQDNRTNLANKQQTRCKLENTPTNGTGRSENAAHTPVHKSAASVIPWPTPQATDAIVPCMPVTYGN